MSPHRAASTGRIPLPPHRAASTGRIPPPHRATAGGNASAQAAGASTPGTPSADAIQPWGYALGVLGAAGLLYVGSRLVNHLRVSRLLHAIRSRQTRLVVDTGNLQMAGLSRLQIQAEVDRLFVDLGHIARTNSGFALLSALAYPAPQHQANFVELDLWDQNGHNAEMGPDFRQMGLSDQEKGAILSDGRGERCRFVVHAGENKDDPAANHAHNTFLPTPSDIVLYHELVHGYHFQRGSADFTVITHAMAQNAVDVGLKATEYQATGLNAVGHHDYSTAALSENRYRAELCAQGRLMPHRPHYRPRP